MLEAVQPSAPLKTADAQALMLVCCACREGLNRATRAMARTSAVINACSPLAIAPIEVPRYRAVNEEVVKLDLDFGDAFSGVLVDREDRLRALWASYSEQVRSAHSAPAPPHHQQLPHLLPIAHQRCQSIWSCKACAALQSHQSLWASHSAACVRDGM